MKKKPSRKLELAKTKIAATSSIKISCISTTAHLRSGDSCIF
ncbi:MAG TPA: hypothetical protein VFS25_07655 [Chitinophaga sp.]|nr:hypothetical protein [Chitinophaga sp.]HEU4552692.1 hypothetical protein [Chitinophaga sp.]